eukprot:2063240-Lingulodinium_polyedra.AAC.1
MRDCAVAVTMLCMAISRSLWQCRMTPGKPWPSLSSAAGPGRTEPCTACLRRWSARRSWRRRPPLAAERTAAPSARPCTGQRSRASGGGGSHGAARRSARAAPAHAIAARCPGAPGPRLRCRWPGSPRRPP